MNSNEEKQRNLLCFNSETAGDERENLKKALLQHCYNLPKKIHRLREEDAGEFALDMVEQVDNIIKNFDPEKSTFDTYLNSVIENRLKQFFWKKKADQKHEEAYLLIHESYEQKVLNDENQAHLFDPVTPNRLPESLRRKLLYAFKRSPGAHKRFFVTAITVMPFMSLSTIREICRIFRFNTNETVKLCEYLKMLCNNQVAETERLEDRRNYFWNREIFLSSDFAAETVKELDHLFDLNRKHHLNRVRDMEKRIDRVPHSLLAEELGVSKKYIDGAVFYSRNLITWLMNPHDTVLLKENRVAGEIADGKWRLNFRYDEIPVISPSKEFLSKRFPGKKK